MSRRPRRGGGTLIGLPLSALAVLYPREVVAFVLAQEVACGRVREQDGRYYLVPECFPADVLAALRRLGPLEAAEPPPTELPRHDRLRPDPLPSSPVLVGRRA